MVYRFPTFRSTRLLSLLFFGLWPLCGMGQEAQKIDLRRFVIDMELGKPIASISRSTEGKPVELDLRNAIRYSNRFKRESGFYEEALTEFIAKSFRNQGVPVQGYDHIFKELRENVPPRYAFGFVLSDVKVSYGKYMKFGLPERFVRFHSNMRIGVSILDVNSHALLYQKELETAYYSDDEGFLYLSSDLSNYFEGAFGQFVVDMLADPEIKAIVFQEKKAAPVGFDSAVKLQMDGAPEKTLIKSALESTVTLRLGSGHGSGAIISPEGLILTCHHNINAAEEVEVVFSNGVSTQASVVRTDPEYDLALLQLSGIKALPIYLSDRASVEPGEEAWVIGTPGYTELGQSVSRGVVSGLRVIQDKEFIQTDASVNPGNSGGPMLDANGRLVGIINAKVIATGMEGLGFAIPVKTIVERLKIELE